MKEVHVVGAAIIENGKVLAAQRPEGKGTPLKWEFAGGKVEPGEDHSEALQRELFEELGIQAEVGEYIATGENDEPDRKILLHVYIAKIIKGVPQAKEHAELRWVDLKDIKELDWAEADIPAVEALLERYLETI